MRSARLQGAVIVHWLGAVALLALGALLVQPVWGQGTIVAVHGIGSARYRSSEIARASGLRPGAAFSPAAVARAKRQLADTGAFTEVSSLLVPANGGQIVELSVTDAPTFVPARFQGFAPITRAEIQAALANIPLYQGALPLLRPGLTHHVQHALQRLLKAHRMAGRVVYALQQNIGGPVEALVFRVEKDAGSASKGAANGTLAIGSRSARTSLGGCVLPDDVSRACPPALGLA